MTECGALYCIIPHWSLGQLTNKKREQASSGRPLDFQLGRQTVCKPLQLKKKIFFFLFLSHNLREIMGKTISRYNKKNPRIYHPVINNIISIFESTAISLQ